jgi:hypothetical protein
VFEKLAAAAADDDDEAETETRGTLPDEALRLYAQKVGEEVTQELLCRLLHIQEAALTNAEGLRKLVKKFDKHCPDHLSPSLLPRLCSANFHVGLSMLEDGINLLRTMLEMEEDTATRPQPGKETTLTIESDIEWYQRTVAGRTEELDWLSRLLLPCQKQNWLDWWHTVDFTTFLIAVTNGPWKIPPMPTKQLGRMVSICVNAT